MISVYIFEEIRIATENANGVGFGRDSLVKPFCQHCC